MKTKTTTAPDEQVRADLLEAISILQHLNLQCHTDGKLLFMYGPHGMASHIKNFGEDFEQFVKMATKRLAFLQGGPAIPIQYDVAMVTSGNPVKGMLEGLMGLTDSAIHKMREFHGNALVKANDPETAHKFKDFIHGLSEQCQWYAQQLALIGDVGEPEFVSAKVSE